MAADPRPLEDWDALYPVRWHGLFVGFAWKNDDELIKTLLFADMHSLAVH